MYEILVQKNNKLIAEAESHGNIESEINGNDLYQIYNISLDERKENTELRKSACESKLENKYEIESQNCMTCMHGKKLNKLSEFNLLYDILKPPKRSKILIAVTLLFYKDV